jgi:hypothetical protein
MFAVPKIVPSFALAEWQGDDHHIKLNDLYKSVIRTTGEHQILLGNKYLWRYFVSKESISEDTHLITAVFGIVITGERRTQVCGPNFADRSLRTEGCGPKFAERRLRTEVCGPRNQKILGFGINGHFGGRRNGDQIAQQLVEKSFRKDVDGRYSVRLPWKFPPGCTIADGNPGPPGNLSPNFEMSYKRLSSVITRLQNNSENAQKCHQIFIDQLQLGIIEPAELSPNSIESFIPHHPVFAHEKIRMVADASAHSKNRPSLTQSLYRGPVILPELIGMLLRFRATRIPILADIEKAFI